MSNLANYINAYTIAGALVVLVAVVLPLFVAIRRRHREARAAKRATEGDLANMMVLLQTMRDTLREQKELARKLNESLDKKVLFIRETVDAALADLDRLREGVSGSAEELRGLHDRLDALRTEADAVQHQLQARPAPTAPTVPAAPQAPEPPAESAAPPEPEPPEPEPAGAPADDAGQLDFGRLEEPLEVVARPERPGPEQSLLDNWVGLDLNEEEPEETRFPIPEAAPEEPESPELAREAFRTLLDLQERAPAPESPAASASAAVNASEGANGRAKLTPLQQRVYEYNDAGMSIAEIANEIGIGKGEVRLILSIRKERS
jgi:hypothetical protein